MVNDRKTGPIAYRQKTFDLNDTTGMTKALHEDGFALIPGVLSKEKCAELRESIDSPEALLASISLA